MAERAKTAEPTDTEVIDIDPDDQYDRDVNTGAGLFEEADERIEPPLQRPVLPPWEEPLDAEAAYDDPAAAPAYNGAPRAPLLERLQASAPVLGMLALVALLIAAALVALLDGDLTQRQQSAVFGVFTLAGAAIAAVVGYRVGSARAQRAEADRDRLADEREAAVEHLHRIEIEISSARERERRKLSEARARTLSVLMDARADGKGDGPSLGLVEQINEAFAEVDDD